ncbi:MAG: DMT family transporter [Deferribacterales bacterium]|jgi:drug/metabolite transporter (DMT)-like permease
MIYHLSLILGMMIVGTTVTVGKVVATGMPQFITLSIRFFLGGLLLYAFMKLGRHKEIKLRGKNLFYVVLQAGDIFVFNVLLLAGLKTVSAVDSGIITGTLPVIVLILSVILLSEKLTLLKTSAVFLATFGVIVINISGSDAGLGESSVTGSLLVLGAFVFEGLFLIMRKRFTAEVPTFQLSAYIAIIVFIFFLPFGIYEAAQGRLAEITVSGYFVIAYYGMFVTAAAYILWFTGIKHVSGMYASVYTAIVPVSSVLISSLTLGEVITRSHLLGMAFVMTAIGVLVFDSRK